MDNELPQKENHNGKYQVQVLKFEIIFCSMNWRCQFHEKFPFYGNIGRSWRYATVYRSVDEFKVGGRWKWMVFHYRDRVYLTWIDPEWPFTLTNLTFGTDGFDLWFLDWFFAWFNCWISFRSCCSNWSNSRIRFWVDIIRIMLNLLWVVNYFDWYFFLWILK